jgi:hypothetical protein
MALSNGLPYMIEQMINKATIVVMSTGLYALPIFEWHDFNKNTQTWRGLKMHFAQTLTSAYLRQAPRPPNITAPPTPPTMI